ncbi:ParB/RepB/Spo0J family partition protein [Candidatus Shapirobacteria bacterium]|nr:ParB/RepB/Spo0J family partition protein [Candidatus Shapirobacteria bacterium]
MTLASVIEIETGLLQPNPLQPRGAITPGSVSELVDSIREHGILEPLLIAKTPAGYQIISGERRWQAARVLGLSRVPAIIKEADSRQMLELALVENVQRKELNPLERARALKRLRDELGLSWSTIGEKIGKSVAYVINSVKLLELPDALKDGLLSGLITEGHARALGGIQDTRLMIEAYKMVLREKASVRRAEEIARLMKEQTRDGNEEGQEFVFSKKEISQLSNQIKEGFSPWEVEVEIIHTRVRGRISLEFREKIPQTKKFLEKIARKIAS